MSATRVMPPTVAPSVWKMYRAMVGVGLACGLLIVSIYQITLPTIERNKAEALQRAIFRVLPEARSSATYVYTEGAGLALAPDGADGALAIYAGRDDAGARVSFWLVSALGMGYQDVIRVLYGYSFARDAVVGLQVLESKETPGLGDRIESDPDFVANFEALDVSLTADLSAVAHPIEVVKHGQKESPWQIDGITGATISSKAIAAMLRDSTATWIPKVDKRKADFTKGGAP